MRAVLTLVRKDITAFVRNRTAFIITFLVPIALIYIFGQVFGLGKTDRGPSGIRIGVVNASTDPAAQKLVSALKAEKTFRVVTDYTNPDKTKRPLTEADARAMIRDRAFNFALVIPADLLPQDRIGVHLKILSNPSNEIESQMVTGVLQKTIFANVPELLGQSLQQRAKAYVGAEKLSTFNRTIARATAETFGGDADKIERDLGAGDYGFGQLAKKDPTSTDASALRRLDSTSPTKEPPSPEDPAAIKAPAKANDVLSKIVNIETEQVVGREVKSPEATRIVGGWAIMFLLFAISGSSAAFFDEENTGIFQRLLSAPVTRAQLLFGRFVYGVLLGLVQLTTLFIAGQFMYGIDVSGHLVNLMVVCVFAAAACTSFGMLIAALAPNSSAASGLATFLVLVMSATGGAWWPLSLMPEFMQHIGKLTVVYWSMEGFTSVLWAGKSLPELLPIIGTLTFITVLVMGVAIWRINRKPIFA